MKDAAQKALDAFKKIRACTVNVWDVDEEIKALEEALAKQEQGGPEIELALHQLIDKICPELDTGNILEDAKTASRKIGLLTKQEQGAEALAQPEQEQRSDSEQLGEPVAIEHSPWTRIEDAKPIVGQPVLVFYKGFAFPDTATFTGVGCGWARAEDFDWQWDEVVNPITHWMPLPAGPDYHCTTTTPQQRTWVELTDEEVADIEHNSITRRQAIRAIEAKLKEKNT